MLISKILNAMIKQRLFPAVMGYACIHIMYSYDSLPLEQTLRQAEDNRIELEEVLKHYQKDKLK